MFSEVAFEELQNYIETGRLGQGIVLTLTPAQPEAGTLARIEWDFSQLGEAHGILSLPGDASSVVQPVGGCELLIDCDPLHIVLTVGEEEARIETNPYVLKPCIKYFRAPERVSLGEPSIACWKTQDTSLLLLLVMEDDLVVEIQAPPEGCLEFVPRQMGELQMTLIAQSKHAPYSPRARIETERTVSVVAPPLWEVINDPLNDLLALVEKPWSQGGVL